MKKTILIGALILLGFNQEKRYKLEFNEAQMNAVWDAIDKSNAPHQVVKQIQELIQSQLKDQLPKPPIDSGKIKK